MPSTPLSNYLRAERERSAFSQEEAAFLLGAKSGAKVSRYEQFARVPNLETALAFEAIYGKPVRELFAGLYAQAEQSAAERAKILQGKAQGKVGGATERKLRALAVIISRGDNQN